MLFKEVPGYQKNKEVLKHMVVESRIPHALLFQGQEASGNLAAAIAFANLLFCKNRNETDSCGTCPSCLKVKSLAHPDLHFSFPIFQKKPESTVSDHQLKHFRKAFLQNPFLDTTEWMDQLAAENKQLSIGVEESGSILRKLSLTSYEGSYKVLILWQPERMNKECANKMLKILEEPPDQTIFILVSHAPDQLLPTILSRVQLLKFTALENNELAEALMNEKQIDKSFALHAARLAEGNYGRALQLLDEISEEQQLYKRFQSFMRVALNFDVFKANQWIEETSRLGREAQKLFFTNALRLIRECLLINYGSENLLKTEGDEKEFLQKFSRFIHYGNYEKIIEALNTSSYHIERNANAKILFMDLTLKMNEYINIKNVN